MEAVTFWRVLFLALIVIAVWLGLVWMVTTAARSQQQCGPEKQMLLKLRDSYAEHSLIRMKQDGATFIVTRSAWGGWTILRTDDKDLSCIIAVGTGSETDRGV